MGSDILLEAGTGELEILEFLIGKRIYAINVIKVKEVIDVKEENITKLPNAHAAIAGLLLVRGEIIPLIDLKFVLENQHKSENRFRVIVCEFNKVKVAFYIDDIVGVHRIKWDQILKPEDLTANSLVIGNIIFNEKIILMLDFEKIVTDINPNSGINENKIVDVTYKDRSGAKLVMADDSPLIRRLITETLTKAGFNSIKMFDDGKQALNYIEDILDKKGEKFIEDVQILITDIEMPQMDGFTLTRKIKEHEVMRKLPVIIFSSLITDELKHKGESLGVDAQLSKPEIGELVDLIDTLLAK
ncbi:MAG: chemotaxis protein [Solirubrobacterales bacterium]